MFDALRRALYRAVFGPYLIQRLHLDPTDAVLMRVPAGSDFESLYVIAKRLSLMLDNRYVVIVPDGMDVSSLPREHLLEAANQAKPSRLPYGVAI